MEVTMGDVQTMRDRPKEKLRGRDRRSLNLSTKLTAVEARVIEDAATRAGKTPSEWAREALLKAAQGGSSNPLGMDIFKADAGTLGVLTLANGERIAAQVVGLNEAGDRLSVQVIPSDGFTRKGLPKHRSHRYIPFQRIASFEPRPDLMEQWPFSDPCRDKSSGPRLLLMSAIFLCMTIGSMLLLVLLRGTLYGLQVTSLVFYILFVLFFTFATTGSRGGGNVPGYKFTCPAVEPQIPRLVWRHLICLVALFVLETTAPGVHSHLPDWWSIPDKKGSTPFEIALLLLGIGLAIAQILTNKSLLMRKSTGFQFRWLLVAVCTTVATNSHQNSHQAILASPSGEANSI
jgi:hypothetical protein